MFCCVGQKKERKIVNGKFRKPFYNFASVTSGKVLDVGQDSEQGAIVVSQRNGGETQKFQIQQKGPDYYIRTKKGKLYLTVEGPQNGAKVYLTTKDQDQNQRFRIQQLKGGTKKYVIYTFFGKVIDVINGQAQSGSIIQEDFIGQAHQLWTLISEQKTN